MKLPSCNCSDYPSNSTFLSSVATAIPAKKRVLIDGGSNWLFENRAEFSELPDFVCGDLDSISEEALRHFQSQLSSSQIVRLHDQDETDFDKSVNLCLQQFKDLAIDYFVVVWGQSGRIDHNLSCISTLIKYNNRKSLPIYLVDIRNSLSCVLSGTKSIKTNLKSSWCSIVPVGEPCVVTTTGFRWNLTDYELKFGKLISTSNEFDRTQDHCTIQSEKPVFFSMHLPE